MKKSYIAKYLLLILISLLVGCSNDNKNTEQYLPIGNYIMEESEEIIKPIVSLEDGNKFTFNYSVFSSYYNHGSYEEEGSNLILETDDGMFKYVFKIKDDTLIFNEKESSEISSYKKVPDGPSYANVIDGSSFSLIKGSNKDEDVYMWDRIPMVMVNGELYLDTGRESDIDGRCGVMDGKISSTLDGSEKPTQDNQSNFGDGYEYQFVDENSVDIIINNKWIRFEKEISDAWGIQLTTNKVTPYGLVLVCNQSGGEPTGDLQTGTPYFIEKQIGNEWVPVEMLPTEHNRAWDNLAWGIPMNDRVEWEVNWIELYGELSDGNYRIGKVIDDFRGSGDYDEKTYYANFELTN